MAGLKLSCLKILIAYPPILGAGNSTRPDGLVEAHVQTHVVTTHKLIGLLKSGSIGDRSWKHIVAAGFSIGGATLNSLADQYPEDTEAVILFGFSHNSLWLYPGFLAGLQAPAYQIDPVRWRDIPWTYQSTSTLQSRAVACYYGDYDHKQLVFDFENRDFDSLGAAITLVLHMLKAPDYKGHVFVGNGDRKFEILCNSICRILRHWLIIKLKRMPLSAAFIVVIAWNWPISTSLGQRAMISRYILELVTSFYSITQVLNSWKML